MIRAGTPAPLGAHWDGQGVNFAVYSGRAESVSLCLFDEQGKETAAHELPECTDGVWHGYLPGCEPGQRYGYRARGGYAPARGLRFNPAKLLLDPYARAMDGNFQWADAVFDFEPGHPDGLRLQSMADSAPFVPRGVVTAGAAPLGPGPRVPWTQTLVYEAHVRGYTMLHPAVPEADRGRYAGMRNGQVLEYLKALGVTAIELLPVHAFIDEQFLQGKALKNFWGYNTLNFFCPSARYGTSDPVTEFRDMVNAIHDAGMEVILDVVYNHTAEGGADGPTLSFRGLDNLAYYRTETASPGRYVNDTGCGNTLNADHPRVQGLVVDSLRYWSREMGVDGFRFDLAPVLGRRAPGFQPDHPLLRAISRDRQLRHCKLIAEPWDTGPGGYHLGGFPPGWAEWNDKYRDGVRRYWRGEDGQAGELARRLHGSADLFETALRKPWASINFITSHDGFTLADLVSYEHRHNQANGEENRDGHSHNYSCNHGAEGPSDDPLVNRRRRRQRLNLLATLLFSQGTPMLLAGDELGNSQGGNNNAYAQDNEIGWVDWSGLESDPDFVEQVRRLIRLRRQTPLLRQGEYRHGRGRTRMGWPDIQWLTPAGVALAGEDWHPTRAKALLVTDAAGGSGDAVAILINGSERPVSFTLPGQDLEGDWVLEFTSDELGLQSDARCQWQLDGHCIALLRLV